SVGRHDSLVGAEIGLEGDVPTSLKAVGDIEGQAGCERPDVVTKWSLAQTGLLTGSRERVALLIEKEIAGVNVGLQQGGVLQPRPLIPYSRHAELRRRGRRIMGCASRDRADRHDRR